MMDKMGRSILNEFLLTEEDGGAGYGGGDMSDWSIAGAGYGQGMGQITSADKMYQTFVKPFTNVFQVAKGATATGVSQLRGGMQLALEMLITTVVPGVNASYRGNFDRMAKRLQKIKDDPSVKGAWDHVLKSLNHEDFLVSAFFYDPRVFVTADFLRKAPTQATQTLDFLTGGNLRALVPQLGVARDAQAAMESSLRRGMLLVEAERETRQSGDVVKKILQHRTELTKNIMQNVGNISSSVKQTFDVAIENIVKVSNRISNAQSLSQLRSTLSAVGDIDTKEIEEALAAAKEKLGDVSDRKLLDAVKRMMLIGYMNALLMDARRYVAGGVHKDSALIKKFISAASKVKSFM